MLISTLELGDADYLKRDFPSLVVDDLNHIWPATHPDGDCDNAHNPDDGWKKEANQPMANKRTSNKSTSNKATSNKATSNKATSNKATTNEATTNKPATNKPATNESIPKGATTNSSATSGIASLGSDYDALLKDLKDRIQIARVRAGFTVNREMVWLYWQMGQEILTRQQQQGWGAKVIDRLAKDLQTAFADMKGFSSRNLKYMRAFAEAYPNPEMVQGVLAQITWYHNIALLEKVKSQEERLWYAHKTVAQGWSRNMLVLHIERGLYDQQGEAITNFEQVLPPSQSDLAQQMIKDPYHFEFLGLEEERSERLLERSLIDHIRDFLLELGVGFAFLGSQYALEVSGKEYRLDLLFYHVHLHCYVVIDLKMGEFEPEFSGKMNFYVAAVDNLLRSPKDEPTIGIILCKSKDKTTVEYALQGIQKPIGVSTYQLRRELPKTLQEQLPTVEQLESTLNTL